MRKGRVYIHRIPAGVITELDNPRRYEFVYDEGYVTDGARPVCLAMPVRKEPYVSRVLFPYFFNMLSEGSNREVQASYLRLDKYDDFGFLLETAEYDTIGAVTVKRIDSHGS